MCRIVTFVAASGGIGQTGIIKKLAESLSAIGRRVCVIDAHFGLNDLALSLSSKSKRSSDFFALKNLDLMHYLSGEVGTARDVAGYCNSGYWVVCSNFAEFDYYRHLEVFDAFVKELSEDFDFVLIDSNSFAPRALELALVPASEVILVLGDGEASVFNGSRLIKKIKGLNRAAEILLLLNKAHIALAASGLCLRESEIKEVLGCELLFAFPLFYKHNIFSKKIRHKSSEIFVEFVRSFLERVDCRSKSQSFRGLLGMLKRKYRTKFEW